MSDFRIIAITIPKSGTHLLSKALNEMGFRKIFNVNRFLGQDAQSLDDNLSMGVDSPVAKSYSDVKQTMSGLAYPCYCIGHLPYSQAATTLLNELNFKKIVLVRDPRDVVISYYHYVTGPDTSSPVKQYYMNLENQDAQIMACITGVTTAQTENDGFLLDVATRVASVAKWSHEPQALLIRFEDMVGEQGGGDQIRQERTLNQLAQHLESNLSPLEISQIANRIFDRSSPTFRQGQIGAWRKYFKPQHIEVFKALTGSQLLELGYENSLDWSI